MEINILYDEDFKDLLETSWLESIIEQVLIAEEAAADAELSLVIVGQDRIQELNSSYLDRDEPTDVISFPMLPEQAEKDAAEFITPPDGIRHLGEVVISFPQAVIQAEEHNHSVKREVAVLLVHGVLHLLGYDHDVPGLVKDMRAREVEIIETIKDKLE
jgi:probable rRNA maturation factor